MSIALQLAGLALLVLAIALAIPALVLFVEIVAALFARPHGEQEGTAPARPRFAVLMPAHDEAAGIAASIATILPQLHSGDRLLVVADNCSDATAAAARGAGAEVVERHDLSHRGKGYALDFGVRALEGDCPPVVIVVDADCSVDAQALHRLATRCAEVGRPVQALYLMHAPPGAGLRLRIAAFAWIVKNRARPLGLLRLRLPCQLMGTGMAFPWGLLRDAPLASGHLVEDMQLGIDLAMAGAAYALGARPSFGDRERRPAAAVARAGAAPDVVAGAGTRSVRAAAGVAGVADRCARGARVGALACRGFCAAAGHRDRCAGCRRDRGAAGVANLWSADRHARRIADGARVRVCEGADVRAPAEEAPGRLGAHEA